MNTLQTPFGQLVSYNIGGGWGTDTEQPGSTDAAYVIRGTDIPRVLRGDIRTVPLRFHAESNLRSRVLRDGDLVFEVSGGSKGQPVGRTLLVTERLLRDFDAPVMCASFCKLIRVDTAVANPGYVYGVLQTAYSDGRLETFQVQSTGITNFKWKPFLEHFQIDLPPLSVQSTLAATLGPLDELISNLGRQIAALERTRNVLLPRLTGGQVTLADLGLDPYAEGEGS